MFKRVGLIRVLARGQALALLLIAGAALAEDKEPLAIIELGAAGEWGLNSGGSSFGPTAAVEFTPVKNWLETSPLTKTSPPEIPLARRVSGGQPVPRSDVARAPRPLSARSRSEMGRCRMRGVPSKWKVP